MVMNFFRPSTVPEHAIHALVTFGRNAGVVRMARHADLVFVGDGDDAVQKIGDALPESVGIHHARRG